MLVYHNWRSCANASFDTNKMKKKGNKKSNGKNYKLHGVEKLKPIRSRAFGPPSRKNSKGQKKDLSNKNIKFLEGLGLKVKQSIENC